MQHVRLTRGLCGALGAVAALCALDPVSVLAAPPSRVVTLITGDRVTVDAQGNTTVLAAQSRKSVSIQVLKIAGHTHVIPSDALPALQAGQLDPRLFDVTELIANGYYNRANTPVIVTGGTTTNTASLYAAPGRTLPIVEGVSTTATADGSLWRSWSAARATYSAAATPSKLWLDGRLQLSISDNMKEIGADVAHKRGLLGDGVKVAVIDSGIDSTHRDLEGQVSAQKNFVSDEEDDRDYVGHGTHVASIIAGTGAESDGRYQGVAPHAKLIDAKACGQQGCPESALVEAMEWAAEQGARVINMSVGGRDTSKDDLVEQALNKLAKKYGVLFVVAAGNDFAFGLTVGSPASAEAALAVGALNAHELPADFSQRGRVGDLSIKPELVAPGVDITAAFSHFVAEKDGPLRESKDAAGYATASGTSMAAPHVSGAAALLSQRHPDWKGDQLKAVLMGSAKLLDKQTALEQGAGLVDIPAALDLELHAQPAAVSFGTQAWPHADDKVSEQAVTLYNDTDNKVTLDLKIDASGPDGASAEGVFSVSDKRLTIGAHDKAEVTLSADTRKGSDGLNSGVLLASNDKVSLHVPFAVEREVESYDLQLRFTDRDGKPATGTQVFADVYPEAGISMGFGDVEIQDDGTAKLRLARAKYTVSAFMRREVTDSDSKDSSTILIYPHLDLVRDTQLAIDARKAKPVAIDAPVSDAELADLSFSYDAVHFGSGSSTGKGGELNSACLGPNCKADDLKTTVSAIWLPAGSADDSAYQFNYAKLIEGELLSGFEAQTRVSDYIRVDTSFARGALSVPASFTNMAIPADPKDGYSASGVGISVALPSKRRIYYIDDPAIAWTQYLHLDDFEADISDEFSGELRPQPGKRQHAQWNQAVFGPVASGLFGPSQQSRRGDSLYFSPSLLGDSEGRGNSGFGHPDVHARLFREGSLLNEFDSNQISAAVPPESASYRIELELKRPALAELSTQVKLAWEFVSETNSDSVTLPVSYIRFLPELDQDSAAQQDTTFKLPIRIEPQEKAEVSDTESLTVDVSYDDGATWTEAQVTGDGKDWTAELEHPQQSGYVSLRAAAIDGDDNVVETTIIRAYRLQ